ncbi:carbonic anhydrase [Aspergillus carlsbadensis]|nr:carbonic anhydrase [Aspergillus carlsbadensis]
MSLVSMDGSALSPKPASSVPSVPSIPGFPLPARPDFLANLLRRNKAWASLTAIESPHLLPALATGQTPEILWIGCSDSRCPETTLLHLLPGDIFVERNIANIINPADTSGQAVIEYAVVQLRVRHIIVCGHKDCGGAKAVLTGGHLSPTLDAWLQPLKAVRDANRTALNPLPLPDAAVELAKMNVHAGVAALRAMPIVADARRTRGLKVHGLLYDVSDGTLEEMPTA